MAFRIGGLIDFRKGEHDPEGSISNALKIVGNTYKGSLDGQAWAIELMETAISKKPQQYGLVEVLDDPVQMDDYTISREELKRVIKEKNPEVNGGSKVYYMIPNGKEGKPPMLPKFCMFVPTSKVDPMAPGGTTPIYAVAFAFVRDGQVKLKDAAGCPINTGLRFSARGFMYTQ